MRSDPIDARRYRQRNVACICVVKTRNEIDQRALARSGRAEQGDCLTRRHVKADAIEHIAVVTCADCESLLFAAGVGKCDIGKLYRPGSTHGACAAQWPF